MSRQVFELSRPGMDEVIADDLGRAFGGALDVQIVNGSGASGQLRGLLQVAGILSVAGTVTSAATFIESVWKAFSALAGTSGFGSPDPDGYLTIVHPAGSRGLAAARPASRHRRSSPARWSPPLASRRTSAPAPTRTSR